MTEGVHRPIICYPIDSKVKIKTGYPMYGGRVGTVRQILWTGVTTYGVKVEGIDGQVGFTADELEEA